MVRPQLGRFIQEDPIHSGVNDYVFAGNDPVNGSDPSGASQNGPPIYIWGVQETDWYSAFETLLEELGGSGSVRRRKRKRVAMARVVKPVISGQNERWSMDFVRDTLADGRVFRALTLVDDFTRECPVIEVDTSLTGERVARVLDLSVIS